MTTAKGTDTSGNAIFVDDTWPSAGSISMNPISPLSQTSSIMSVSNNPLYCSKSGSGIAGVGIGSLEASAR